MKAAAKRWMKAGGPDSRCTKNARAPDLGFVHIDSKRPPKLHVGGREFRKRHLHVAIDHRSRSVHLAVKEDMVEPSAAACSREAAQAFRLAHVLTDCGSGFATGA